MNSGKPSKASPRNPPKQVSLVHPPQHYNGPIPSPEALEKYEQVQPGFADRLMRMAEKEQEERIKANHLLIEIEAASQKTDSDIIKRGQLFGLISAISIISLCIFSFYLGYKSEARDIAVWVIASVAAVFVTGRFLSRKSDKKN